MIPKNKTISVLHPYLNKVGGAVNMMIYLSNLLVREGNEVKFYTFAYDETLFSNKLNFEVIVSSKLAIAYKIRKSDYLIIGNSPMQFVGVFSKIIFLSKAKLIWWHHHYPWYYGENTNFLILTKRLFERFFVKFIDEVVVNSEYLRKSLEKIYSIKVKVLHPMVDKIFTEVKRREKDFSKKTVFTYGRWVKGKNLVQVFETYEYLKNKLQDVNLIIGGVGEELAFYENKYKEDKKISFLGLVDNVSIIDNFQKSLVFLFPSKIDSFGMTILEASYCSVPTIAFDINSASELIDDGESGFLVDSVEEFNKKTLKLLTKGQLCEVFSKKSRDKAEMITEARFNKELGKIF